MFGEISTAHDQLRDYSEIISLKSDGYEFRGDIEISNQIARPAVWFRASLARFRRNVMQFLMQFSVQSVVQFEVHFWCKMHQHYIYIIFHRVELRGSNVSVLVLLATCNVAKSRASLFAMHHMKQCFRLGCAITLAVLTMLQLLIVGVCFVVALRVESIHEYIVYVPEYILNILTLLIILATGITGIISARKRAMWLSLTHLLLCYLSTPVAMYFMFEFGKSLTKLDAVLKTTEYHFEGFDNFPRKKITTTSLYHGIHSSLLLLAIAQGNLTSVRVKIPQTFTSTNTNVMRSANLRAPDKLNHSYISVKYYTVAVFYRFIIVLYCTNCYTLCPVLFLTDLASHYVINV